LSSILFWRQLSREIAAESRPTTTTEVPRESASAIERKKNTAMPRCFLTKSPRHLRQQRLQQGEEEGEEENESLRRRRGASASPGCQMVSSVETPISCSWPSPLDAVCASSEAAASKEEEEEEEQVQVKQEQCKQEPVDEGEEGGLVEEEGGSAAAATEDEEGLVVVDRNPGDGE